MLRNLYRMAQEGLSLYWEGDRVRLKGGTPQRRTMWMEIMHRHLAETTELANKIEKGESIQPPLPRMPYGECTRYLLDHYALRTGSVEWALIQGGGDLADTLAVTLLTNFGEKPEKIARLQSLQAERVATLFCKTSKHDPGVCMS